MARAPRTLAIEHFVVGGVPGDDAVETWRVGYDAKRNPFYPADTRAAQPRTPDLDEAISRAIELGVFPVNESG